MPYDARYQGETVKVNKKHLDLVKRACELLDSQDEDRMTLADLAGALTISPWHLQRLFKKIVGVSPQSYSAERRLQRFKSELRDHGRVAEATYGAGYGSSSRVYENADRTLGMTPASYAKGGKGAQIVFSLTDSPLGRLLVAATPKGLCFLALGERDADLIADLHGEFPAAQSIERDDAAIQASLEVLMDHLEGRTPYLGLPLDIRGTAFQRQVWSELMAIPYGETLTYSELAERLGLQGGQRAVGRACALNPVSLVIPCHRALREDGALAGYRWGLERKEKLLRNEAENTTA